MTRICLSVCWHGKPCSCYKCWLKAVPWFNSELYKCDVPLQGVLASLGIFLQLSHHYKLLVMSDSLGSPAEPSDTSPLICLILAS